MKFTLRCSKLIVCKDVRRGYIGFKADFFPAIEIIREDRLEKLQTTSRMTTVLVENVPQRRAEYRSLEDTVRQDLRVRLLASHDYSRNTVFEPRSQKCDDFRVKTASAQFVAKTKSKYSIEST